MRKEDPSGLMTEWVQLQLGQLGGTLSHEGRHFARMGPSVQSPAWHPHTNKVDEVVFMGSFKIQYSKMRSLWFSMKLLSPCVFKTLENALNWNVFRNKEVLLRQSIVIDLGSAVSQLCNPWEGLRLGVDVVQVSRKFMIELVKETPCLPHMKQSKPHAGKWQIFYF